MCLLGTPPLAESAAWYLWLRISKDHIFPHSQAFNYLNMPILGQKKEYFEVDISPPVS